MLAQDEASDTRKEHSDKAAGSLASSSAKSSMVGGLAAAALEQKLGDSPPPQNCARAEMALEGYVIN